jgi:hypothetical protein
MPGPNTYDLPAKLPRWGDNPPTPPPTTITEPTETQKDQGFQPGLPIRQFFNWLYNLIYQWIVWFSQTTHRTSDLSPDHALPAGSLPSYGTGSGLVISAGDFSARVFSGGYEVPLTSYPLAGTTYTYSASADTYWDLGRNAAWTPVVVSAGSAAPSVTANSVRCFKVTTSSVDRITVVDLRDNIFRVNQKMRLENTLVMGASTPPASSGVMRSLSQRVISPTNFFDSLQELWTNGITAASQARVYSYSYVDDYRGSRTGYTLVWGAYLSADGSTWYADGVNAQRIDIRPVSNNNGLCYYFNTGLTVGSSFTWLLSPLPADSGLLIGTELQNGGYTFQPMLQYWMRNTSSKYVLIEGEINGSATVSNGSIQYGSGSGGVLEYRSATGPDGGGYCKVQATNCLWNNTTQLWNRVTSNQSAWLVVDGANGLSIYNQPASGPSTWSDAITSGAWTCYMYMYDNNMVLSAPATWIPASGTLNNSGSTLLKGLTLTSGGGITQTGVPPSTPAANTLYGPLFPRASATISTSSTGTITVSGYGIASAVAQSDGSLLVSLNNPLPTYMTPMLSSGAYNSAFNPTTQVLFSWVQVNTSQFKVTAVANSGIFGLALVPFTGNSITNLTFGVTVFGN